MMIDSNAPRGSDRRPVSRTGHALSVVTQQVCEDGQDAAVVVGRGGEVEFGEDGPYVGFHGLVGDEEGVGDVLVGASLGHEGQDVHLSSTEGVERVAPAGAANEQGDDCGVDDEPAGADLADRVAEFVDIADAVLEQVPGSLLGALNQRERILRLYVLG